MTQTQFTQECISRTICPEIALENDDLVQALRNRDDLEVIRILDQEF